MWIAAKPLLAFVRPVADAGLGRQIFQLLRMLLDLPAKLRM
jgi:hypothetical protein